MTAVLADLPATAASSMPVEAVLAALQTSSDGLSTEESTRRRALVGANALRTHHASALPVLARQLRSPLLVLLVGTAAVSFFVGDRADSVIIAAIVLLSVGLGFANEYRAEQAVEALHAQIAHRSVVRRDGRWDRRDMTELVPGDVVRIELGVNVPADLRLLRADHLECDEAVLTGESRPAPKAVDAMTAGGAPGEPSCIARMGTIVSAGRGEGVVVTTGARTDFGAIAAGLGERHAETEFQVGLRGFSRLLVQVAAVLSASIFAINLVLQRPVLDALLLKFTSPP